MRAALKAVAAMVTVPLGLLLALSTGVAAAHGGGHGGSVTMTGTTTCTVNNIDVNFATPLTATATTGSTTVTVTANVLKGCTNASQGGVRMKNGHVRSLEGTLASGATCAGFLAGTSLPALSGGTAMWTPPSRVAGSTGVSFPAGTLSTSGGNLRIAYSGGTVNGSFATTAATLGGTSNDSAATLSGDCASGLSDISFRGSVTL
jgi:hypothetical protein